MILFPVVNDTHAQYSGSPFAEHEHMPLLMIPT